MKAVKKLEEKTNVIPFPVRVAPTMKREDFGASDLSAIIGKNTACIQVEGNDMSDSDVRDGDIAVIDFDCIPKVGDVVLFTDTLTIGLFNFYKPCVKVTHTLRGRA